MIESFDDPMSTSKPNLRPTSQDACRRLLILRQIFAVASYSLPPQLLEELRAKWSAEGWAKFARSADSRRDWLCQSLVEAGLWEFLSPLELEFMKSTAATLTQQQHIDASWSLEAAPVFMWALGMLSQLPLWDTQADAEILKQIPKNNDDLIRIARLRPQAEINRARDIAELWHWRSRTRQLIDRGEPFPTKQKLKAAGYGSYDDIIRTAATKAAAEGDIPPTIDCDFPANGKAYRDLTDAEWSTIRSITIERHFALNWLCGYAPDNRWDETPTGT